MDQLTVLIADDHPVFRKGLKTLLATIPNVSLAGEASTGDEALRLAGQLQPDVILMDLHMPGAGGLAAIRKILQTSPHIRILVVTMFQDDDSVFAAMRAGARGYVLKGAGKEDVLRAIEAVARGEALFGPAIAQRLVAFFGALGRTAGVGPPLAFPELTEREREVLHLIAQGINNSGIAERLSLSPKTVGNHISNIFNKLRVADRAEAIVRARGAGLG
jgi:DNA-binding NarL/FixJ family response regulator